MQQKREKKRQAVVFVSSFHPRGGVFCCLWRDGAGFFFSRRDGAVLFFFRGGTGRLLFFSEAGRGGFFCFFSTGRDGAVFFFFLESRDGTVVFGGGIFFGGTGQNRYTVPPAVHVKALKNPARRGYKVEKHHLEGKNVQRTLYIQRESGNDHFVEVRVVTQSIKSLSINNGIPHSQLTSSQ